MTIHKTCSQYCIDVIRCLLQEKEIPEIPEGVTLGQLYAFAKLHNVEAMVFHGLEQLDVDENDGAFQNWSNRAAMILTQSIVQLAERDAVFAALTEAGIALLPMKGCWMKEQYPEIDYRQMSDLDMLIPQEKAQEARKIMLSQGYQPENVEAALNHTGYLKAPYTEVELHVRPLEEDGGYYDDVWQRAVPVEGYDGLFRFLPEDEYIFYLIHLNKHLEDAGTGIRSVLDCVVYRDVYPNMDREYLKQELDKWNLWQRALEIEALSDCWFRNGTEIPETLSELAHSILEAGSYGTVEKRSQNRMEKLQGKYKNPIIRGICYWVLRICRPLNEMRLTYPVLSKLPWLLPVFWIWRAVAKFAAHPKAIASHVKMVFCRRKDHG